MAQGEGSLRTCEAELARVLAGALSHEHLQMPYTYPVALTKLICAPVRLSVSQYVQIAPSQLFSNCDKDLCPALGDSPASSFKTLLRLRLLGLEEVECWFGPGEPVGRV